MGYMRHHAIIVTSWRTTKRNPRDVTLHDARDMAVEIFKKHRFSPYLSGDPSSLVSPVVESVVNSYASFFIAPDGSKEGWSESDAGNQARKEFIQWLNEQSYEDKSPQFDWVEVQYGDDELITKVTNDSDAPLREAEGKPK